MTTTVTPTGLEPPTIVLEVIPGKCPQCGHSTEDKAHTRYGTHCRWTQGRAECLCQGPLELRRP
jgi:hypothetical protein